MSSLTGNGRTSPKFTFKINTMGKLIKNWDLLASISGKSESKI